ncbi:sugar phosphate isomerase/epimerase family protein [Robiginitalea sp. SC105]|uniref:sugar phosphate isomerase/epimerase family protein n=1 Tax=Robiginitalea sp. SC105 TaxID=2762332 RepID=UPI00351C3F3E
MPGEQYKGKLDHILRVISKAGFSGIEPETSFFGPLEDPVRMREALDACGLELAALCHVEDWRNPKESAGEAHRAGKWMDFLAHFPDTLYLLVQMPGKDRQDLVARQSNVLSCLNAIGARASARGIACSFHPNSPAGSVFRTAEDYAVLMEGLHAGPVGYCPDVGHIAKGGMDPVQILSAYRSLVNLVHYKDIHADGRWARTGTGVIDFAAITGYLKATGYTGWIVMEDECDRAISDPDGLTLEAGKYLDGTLKPLIGNMTP